MKLSKGQKEFRKWYKAGDHTNRSAAKALKVSYFAVSTWLAGTFLPRPYNAKRIEKATGIKASSWFF